MYHVVHLIHVFLLERRRSVELCKRLRIKLFYRINLLGTAFKQKNKLPFKLLKPQFIGRTGMYFRI